MKRNVKTSYCNSLAETSSSYELLDEFNLGMMFCKTAGTKTPFIAKGCVLTTGFKPLTFAKLCSSMESKTYSAQHVLWLCKIVVSFLQTWYIMILKVLDTPTGLVIPRMSKFTENVEF